MPNLGKAQKPCKEPAGSNSAKNTQGIQLGINKSQVQHSPKLPENVYPSSRKF